MMPFFTLLFMCFSYFGTVFSCEMTAVINEYILFIGNPGVGKSTLINSLVGKHVAESGLSSGSGLTMQSQEYQHNGYVYIDTPGLSDTKIRTQATQEIEKALKMNGKYRIFFVLALSAGRVRPDDINTVNSVMESIAAQNKVFNIIINNVSPKEIREIFNDPIQKKLLFEQINSGKNKTDRFYYIERCEDVENGTTEFIIVNDKLDQFMYRESSSFFLESKNVAEIKDLEKLKEDLKIKLAQEQAEAQERLKAQRKKEKSLQAELMRQQEELESYRYNYYERRNDFSCIVKQAF